MTRTLQSAQSNEAVKRPGRWLALSVLVLAVLLVAVDATVLGPRPPTSVRTSRPPAPSCFWIGDVYSFVIAGLLVSMGKPRRPHRPQAHPAHRRHGVRRDLGPQRLRVHARADDRRPGPARRRGRHPDARHPRPDPQPLPRPALTQPRRGACGRRALGRCGGRPGRRRFPAGALLVGLGLPHQPARDGRPGRRRHQAAARVPQPEPGPLGPAQRHPLAGRHGRRRVRRQGGRRARVRVGHARRGSARRRRALRLRPPPADHAGPAARHAAVPATAASAARSWPTC